MRRLLIVTMVLAFCSAPTWADSVVVDVNAWATFTATQPCSSNCIETIGVSFLYTQPVGQNAGIVNDLMISSSGFLGTFSAISGDSPSSQGYFPFFDAPLDTQYDEIDLTGFDPLTRIRTGIDTMGFDLFFCRTAACDNAYGPDATPLHPNPTSESSVVTPVTIPDGDSSPLLMLVALGTVGLGWRWRWRRKELRAM